MELQARSNVLQNYNLDQTEKVSIIKNWLGREGLQVVATLTQDEQEAYNNDKGLFNTCNRKFKPPYNRKIKSLQFCRLIRQSNESMETWMDRLKPAVIKCNYKEIDRQIKDQFVHCLNDE